MNNIQCMVDKKLNLKNKDDKNYIHDSDDPYQI